MSKRAILSSLCASVLLLASVPMSAAESAPKPAEKPAATNAPVSVFKDKKLEAAVRRQVFAKRESQDPLTAADVATVSTVSAPFGHHQPGGSGALRGFGFAGDPGQPDHGSRASGRTEAASVSQLGFQSGLGDCPSGLSAGPAIHRALSQSCEGREALVRSDQPGLDLLVGQPAAQWHC